MQLQITIPQHHLEAAIADALRKTVAPLPETPKLSYRLREAAKATGMSVSWFRSQIRAKKISTITLGRNVLIPASEINRLLNSEKDAPKCSTNEETFGGLSFSSMVQ
jgi:excisionase family DNA binding protein